MSTIFIDYANVIQKAEEMEDLSKDLKKDSVSLIDDWNSSNAWSGDAADSFKKKLDIYSFQLLAESTRTGLLSTSLKNVTERFKRVEETAVKMITGG